MIETLPPAQPDTPDSGADRQARDWVYRLSSSDDPALKAECAAWRAEQPENDAAFRLAWATWHGIGAAPIATGTDWRQELQAIKRGRPWQRRLGVPLALAASLVAILLAPQALLRPDLAVETARAEHRLLALADGSRLTIGAQTGVEVSLDKEERKVVLDHGQAFFEVAHDPNRPFVVLAGRAEIRVLGTKFDVRRVGDEVEVSVLEGRVEVSRRPRLPLIGGKAPERLLTAGTQAELPPEADNFAAPRRATVPPGEWRSGRLYYVDAPLSEIVADANRYSETPVLLASAELGAMRLSASFRAGDMNGFLQNIEASLPVRSERSDDGSVHLVPR